ASSPSPTAAPRHPAWCCSRLPGRDDAGCDSRSAERYVRSAGRPDPARDPGPVGRERRLGERARRPRPGDLPPGRQQAPAGARAGGPGDTRPCLPAASGPPARRADRRGHGLARPLPALLRGVARPARRAPVAPARILTMVEIEFARTYAAPRELVWDAWTDPDQMAQWWGPRGVTTPRESIELDLRPGGRIRFEMVDDASGTRYPNSGTVLEVDPPSRLVYADDGFPDGTGKGTATVTFTAVDERTTTLRVRIVADFDETVRAGAEQGWGSQLEKLAEHLAAA